MDVARCAERKVALSRCGVPGDPVASGVAPSLSDVQQRTTGVKRRPLPLAAVGCVTERSFGIFVFGQVLGGGRRPGLDSVWWGGGRK